MPVVTKDERVARADAAIETAIATLLSAENSLNRADALKLLARRMVRKSSQGVHLQRPQWSQTWYRHLSSCISGMSVKFISWPILGNR
jgi:hypothetical protein